MVNYGIAEVKYIETTDNTLCDIKRFQYFLHRHFYKQRDYEAMRPRADQPGRFFATAKTCKFETIEHVSLDSLKLRPIWLITQGLIFTMVQKSSQNTSVL